MELFLKLCTSIYFPKMVFCVLKEAFLTVRQRNLVLLHANYMGSSTSTWVQQHWLWCLNVFLFHNLRAKCLISCFMGNKLWPRPALPIDNVNEGRPAKPAIRTFGSQDQQQQTRKKTDTKDAKIMEEELQTDRGKFMCVYWLPNGRKTAKDENLSRNRSEFM